VFFQGTVGSDLQRSFKSAYQQQIDFKLILQTSMN
jgi:hypothetical protein